MKVELSLHCISITVFSSMFMWSVYRFANWNHKFSIFIPSRIQRYKPLYKLKSQQITSVFKRACVRGNLKQLENQSSVVRRTRAWAHAWMFSTVIQLSRYSTHRNISYNLLKKFPLFSFLLRASLWLFSISTWTIKVNFLLYCILLCHPICFKL